MAQNSQNWLGGNVPNFTSYNRQNLNNNWGYNRGNLRGRISNWQNRNLRNYNTNFNSNFRNQNGSWPRNTRGNFRAPRFPRRRGRGGYSINTIQSESKKKGEIPNSVNESSPKLSIKRTFLPILSFITIFALFQNIFFIHISAEYQLCNDNTPYALIAPPNNHNCSIPQIEDILQLEATVIVRRVEPIIFPLFKCVKKVDTICSFSLFKIYTSIPINETYEEKVAVEDCWHMVTNGNFDNLELIRLENDVWKTKKEAGIRYSWLGKECNTTVNYIVEKGLAATKGRRTKILSDMANFGNHTIEDEFFSKPDMTFVWKKPPPEVMCDYQEIGTFPAIITDKLIII